MDKVALLDTSDRAALFGETGAVRGVANTVIEKDFWVCWTLKRLFDAEKRRAHSDLQGWDVLVKGVWRDPSLLRGH